MELHPMLDCSTLLCQHFFLEATSIARGKARVKQNMLAILNRHATADGHDLADTHSVVRIRHTQHTDARQRADADIPEHSVCIHDRQRAGCPQIDPLITFSLKIQNCSA
ncbi:hypothetical protein ASE23_27135 [Rhizobium sp. Root73]|nr:hypothetical protein ASD36_26320 [Rhizobium sp. Root1334]KRC06161.1 hypothetical protein ASE23_27135 [Rhizobium sp. Root73]